MFKNWITFLALKNLLTRGTLKVRFFKVFLIFGAPLLVAYILADGMRQWEYIKENGFWIAVSQVGLFVFFWLREAIELTVRNNITKSESQLIERNYVYCSVLLFIWFQLLKANGPYRHGAELFVVFFALINFGFIVSGLALTIAARKRKWIFWLLLVATLMAISYIAIPYLSSVCRPPYVVYQDPMPSLPGPLERIWKYCL